MEANPSQFRPARPTRPATRRLGLFALLIPSMLLLSNGVTAQGEAAQDRQGAIELARKALSEWTEARRTISAEREEWRKAKQTLQSQKTVVQREITSLDQRIADARQSIDSAEQKHAELEQESNRREADAAVLEQRIALLERRTLELLGRVPAPLAARVAPISQRLPENEEQARKPSLSTRYQNVIGVLNAVDKWNREVTVETEVRQLGNGHSLEVSVIYVGLGQAFYVGGKGADGRPTVAGVGSANKDGWTWTERDDLAAAIQTAVAIYKNDQLAKLVRLPVRIL